MMSRWNRQYAKLIAVEPLVGHHIMLASTFTPLRAIQFTSICNHVLQTHRCLCWVFLASAQSPNSVPPPLCTVSLEGLRPRACLGAPCSMLLGSGLTLQELFLWNILPVTLGPSVTSTLAFVLAFCQCVAVFP